MRAIPVAARWPRPFAIQDVKPKPRNRTIRHTTGPSDPVEQARLEKEAW